METLLNLLLLSSLIIKGTKADTHISVEEDKIISIYTMGNF